MGQALDLKRLEKKTFTSRFQDGLIDLQIGLCLVLVWFAGFFGPGTAGPVRIKLVWIGFVVVIIGVGLLKRYLTHPRMGTFQAAPARKKRLRIGAWVLFVLVLAQVGLVVVQATDLGLSGFDRLQGAVLIGLAFTIPWAFFAWASDFERGYLQALLLGGSIAVGITFDDGTAFLLSGVLLSIIGLALFVRFLIANPQLPEGHDAAAA